MIYDFFMYNGEEHLLECRLNILDKVVDRFVVSSCPYSHSGIYKGLNRIPADLQLKFGHKITFVEVPWVDTQDPFVNEHNGRHMPFQALKDTINPEDILLICDLDEIPNPDIVLEESKKLDKFITFRGDYLMFCFDLYGRESIDGILVKKGHINGTNLNFLRSHRTNFKYPDLFKHIPNSSWHFSSVNTPEAIARKMSYFCHCNEMHSRTRNPSYIREIIKNKCGDFDINKPNVLQEYPIEKLPKYIQENKEKFKHLFYGNYK